MKALIAILAALALAGCASDYGKYAAMQTDIQTAKSNADAERYKAIAAIGGGGDVTAKVASLFALAAVQAAPQSMHLAAPKTAGDTVREWAGILVPSLVQGYGIFGNTKLGMRQSDNATALGISTNEAFVGMAGQIQAPAANMTIGESGVIGAGSYSTDTHAITDSYNPVDNSQQPIDNSNHGNPVYTPEPIPE